MAKSIIVVTYIHPLADGTEFESLETSYTKERAKDFLSYSEMLEIVEIPTDKKHFILNYNNIGKIEIYDA